MTRLFPFTVPLKHDIAVIGAIMMCSGFRAVLDLSCAAGGAVKYQILGLLDI